MDSIPLEGYVCLGATPISEAVASNPSLTSDLRTVLAVPSNKELWSRCVSVLIALQTTVSLVTLSALERILLHYDAQTMPIWIIGFVYLMLGAGEVLIVGLCGQIFEVHIRKILFYKSLQFGVLIDFKNVKASKKYFHMGGALICVIFLAAFSLMWTGYSVAVEKSWTDFLGVLIANLLIATSLQNVLKPYLDCSSLEESLISLPKFLEKDPINIKKFLSECAVLPEKAIYARLCDLINIQQEACLRATIAFARSAGIKYSDPALIVHEVRRAGDKAQIAQLESVMLDARKQRPISLSQLQDCGKEGKEMRGAIEGKKPETRSLLRMDELLRGTAGLPKIENDQYVYRVLNSSKDADSVIMGRYSFLLIFFGNAELYWMDEDLDKLIRSRGGFKGNWTFFRQYLLMLIALLGAGFFSFAISAIRITSSAQTE